MWQNFDHNALSEVNKIMYNILCTYSKPNEI